MVDGETCDLFHGHFLLKWQKGRPQQFPVPALLTLIVLYSFTHDPRASALYCLLTQAGLSLMAQEKQLSASQPLVFFWAHYI